MSTYSMAQVETLTGISSHSLRIWERRYTFIKPARTATNIRYYTDEELVKLLNIAVLVRNGYKISKINAMPNEELHKNLTSILSEGNVDNEDEINILTKSMIEMNEADFNELFQKTVTRKGLQATVIELIYPFLTHVGMLWNTNKLIPVQEHFISNLIRQKIVVAIDALPVPKPNAPSICMFLLDGEDHEIGLLLASYIASNIGFKVYYLGQNLPVSNIGEMVEISKPSVMFSMFISPSPNKIYKKINSLQEQTDTPLLISGSAVNFEKLEMSEKLIHIKSPTDLVDYLTNMI